MDLAIHVLGEYVRELVVTSATAHIRLLLPSQTLGLDILAYLGHIAELGVS